jgi:PAS domain S-box-containing protein
MATPTITPGLFESRQFPLRQVSYGIAAALSIALFPFLICPTLASRIMASNFLPHLYCYVGKSGLVWTHVIADSLIGLSYLMISGTLVYLVHRGRHDIPFHWMFLAFGSFIVACSTTHFMEVVTVWVPVYVLSAGVKIITASVSLVTAVLLPFTVPQILSLIQSAKASEAAELDRRLAQEALIEREAKFHEIADNIQEIFWMVDAVTLQAIYVNPAFEQITGRTSASLLDDPLSYREIIHPDDRARVLGRLDELRNTGKLDEEFRITRTDGTIRWLEAQGFRVPDSEGNIYRLAGVAQDITERKQSEAKLREYEKAVEGLEEMIVVVDRDYRYVLANQAYLNYRDMQREQVVGHSVQEMLSASVFEIVKQKLDECFKGNVVTFEIRNQYPKLGVRDLLVTYRPVDGAHEFDRAACIIQDITERKRADVTLARLATIVASSDDAIISKDLNGVITSWNASAERLLGYTEAEMIGRPITTIIPPDLLHEEADILRRLRRGGHIQHYETTRVTKQGKRIDLSLTISPMRDSTGTIVGASKIARDITERNRVKKALQQSEADARARAEELEVILDAVPGMALIARDDAAKTITGSRAAYELLQLPYGANISKSATDGTRPSNFRILANGRELTPSELPLQMAATAKQEIRESELTLQFEDGTSRQVFGNAVPLLDHEGNVRGAVGVFVDITERKRAEEALRESEDRYRDLVEHSQDLLCTHDLDGNLLSANPAPAKILGYEVAELLKIPMREIVAPEYRDQFDAYLSRMKSAGTDKGFMAVLTRTGKRRIWEYNNTLRTEGVPAPIVRGMAHDVTERMRTEKKLRASEELFRQLAENIREVFYLTYSHNLDLVYVSPAYEQVWGRTCESLYQTPDSFLEAIHPDDRERARRSYLNRDLFETEYRVIRPDGSVRWILDRGFPVRNSEGQIYRLAGLAEDITERKLAEQALRESEAETARVSRIVSMGELTASIAHEINQPLAAVATNASASLHWLAVQPPNLAEAREAMTGAMQAAQRAGNVIERVRTLLKKASPELRALNLNDVIKEVLALADRELTTGRVAVPLIWRLRLL